ncbi:MAG: type 4a pilus biogenesis protein PilO [Candidatus Kuenenbacteria bacterium]
MNRFQQKIAIIFVQNFKIFLILTILIIFGLGYFLFVKQFYSELKEKRKELGDFKQNILITKKKQLDDLKILKKEYQKLEGLEVQKLLVILPFQKNIPDLFKQIEDITQKSGVTLLSLDIAEGGAMDISNAKEISLPENKNLKALNISAEIGGIDYFTLKVFLNNLEKNIRLIDVISFDFNSSKKTQKINLRTYYLE